MAEIKVPIQVNLPDDWIEQIVNRLRNDPEAEWVEIIRCKDCRKHNVSAGYKEDCCALYEWRGMSYGHEHDYQYCSHAERRTDE